MTVLGFDTSNYTTSAALFFPETQTIRQEKLLLPVRPGEKGLRQSDAVFHHTVQLPQVAERLFSASRTDLEAVCASEVPRLQQGSYMPCFLVGRGVGEITANACGVPFYTTSHQHGHIAAALFGAERLDLLKSRFLAFHVSGGTTEALLVEPDEEDIFKCTLVASSLDLKAGQAIDRAGLLLGLRFPCGKELDALSRKSERTFLFRPSLKGADCSLSGIENKCRQMKERGEPDADIAKFCIDAVCATLDKMTERLRDQYGNLPLLYAGGVMSNSLISARLTEKYGAFFAPPEFSSDNAAGVAILGYLKHQRRPS